jgi:hypothetical protein
MPMQLWTCRPLCLLHSVGEKAQKGNVFNCALVRPFGKRVHGAILRSSTAGSHLCERSLADICEIFLPPPFA